MAKTTKAVVKPQAALWPVEQNTVYKIKIDRDTQEFYVEGLEGYEGFTEFTFRTLEVFSKLKSYNEDYSKTEVESTLFAFSGDARDSRGSHVVRDGKTVECCGRVIPVELTKKMTPEAQQENKEKARWYTYIFGIAYVPGKNPIIADFQLPGNKQVEVNTILKKIKEDKKEYNRAELRFVAEHNDEFDWPELEVTADFSRDLPVSGMEPFLDTIRAHVSQHNDAIDAKAAKYKKYGGKPYNPKMVKKKY